MSDDKPIEGELREGGAEQSPDIWINEGEELIYDLEEGSFKYSNFPFFSSDGSRMANKKINTDKSKNFVVNGESIGESFPRTREEIVFSPDGSHIAAGVSWSNVEQTIAVDGVPWQERFLRINSPVFGPDGQHVAASVKDDQGWTIAVDGKTWAERYDDIALVGFSLDGQKIVAVGQKEGRRQVIVNEKPDGRFQNESINDATISPDGQAIAAMVGQPSAFGGEGYTISVNGKVWDIKFKEIYGPTYSPDGTKVAARIEDDEGATIAINGVTWDTRFKGGGVKRNHLAQCERPIFSPDSQKVAAVMRISSDNADIEDDGDNEIVVVNGKQVGKPFEQIFREPIFSLDGKNILCIGNRGYKIYRQIINIEQ